MLGEKRQSEDVGLERSRCGSAMARPTSVHDDAGSVLGLAQWAKDPGRSQTWLGSPVALAVV